MKVIPMIMFLFIPMLFGDAVLDTVEDICAYKVPTAIEKSFQDTPHVELIEKVAREENVDPLLVLAVVKQESGFNQYAMRFEPKYYGKLLRLKKYTPDEAKRRSYAYGLGQVIGDTARSLGFTGQFGELLEPEVNIRYTCKKLRWCLNRFDGHVSHAVSGYNGGAFIVDGDIHITNMPYVDSVLSKLNYYKRGVECTVKAGWSLRS